MLTQINSLFCWWRVLGIMLVCFWLLFTPPGYAADPLYQATVPVSGQGKPERQKAIRQAMEQVVIKLSGQQNSLNNAGLRAALAGSMSAVEQFQYLQEESQTFLSVSFQPALLDGLLARNGIPVWGGKRPEVLVWMAVDNGQQRFIAQQNVHYAARSLQRVADNRGIPLLLPMMDLEDRRSIAFNDVWGDFGERMEGASRRYGAQHMLAVRILKLAGGQWSARWSLTHQQATSRWQNRSGSLSQAIEVGFARVAEHLAERYRPRLSDQAQTYTLLVSRINDVRAFARVANYLESMDRVESVRWDRFENNQAWFQLVFLGDLASIEQALSVGRVLYPSLDTSRQPGVQNQAPAAPLLRYQPQP